MELLHITFRFLNQSVIKPDQNIFQPFDGILEESAKRIAYLVNLVILCAIVGCFGIAANIINIQNFIKQGFENTVNISLLGIAVSDLCALITVVWLGVCVNPLLQTDDMEFEEIEYLTAGWPHCLFARTTCMITAYITIERCLCVTIPLKVKHVITKTKTKVIVVSIYVSLVLTAIPTYYSSYIGWTFDPVKNISVLGLCRIDNWKQIEPLTFLSQTVLLGMSFGLLVIFTLLLVVNIRRKTEWRKCATSNVQQETISQRDKKLVRMIIFISVILIVCLTPGMICFTVMSIEFDFNVGEKYDNLYWVIWSTAILFQTVNSSVNIFVYYSMSTKYRVILHETFAVYIKRLGFDNEKSLEGADDS